MKVLLIGINAKYIHPNLAIRLLKANCDYNIDIIEFNIKDDLNVILDLTAKYDIIGFSCYIWNIEIIKNLLKRLKQSNKTIILGGPEVSFNPASYNTDYVIKGEGEIAFNLLINALNNNLSTDNIPNLYTKRINNSIKSVFDLDQLKSPYFFKTDYKNQIMYIESSRGCPYRCSYCMASLEKDVRFFNIDLLKKNILYLMDKGAKTFKFLDRTFNCNNNRAIEIISFIINNYKENCVFQFEITGEIITPEFIKIINSAPKSLFRLEIGIQSTNINTNKLINRPFNKEKLFNNIRMLNTNIHLDLIAGLPKEDYSSFIKSFNDAISLKPTELQLGILKLLKGTELYNNRNIYKYIFNSSSPYDVISNDSLNSNNLKNIKIVEEVIDHYYNKGFFNKSFNLLLDNVKDPFSFLLDFGIYYQNKYQWIGYLLDDLFKRLYDYFLLIKISWLDDILILMKYDYLSHFKLKPKLWWEKHSKKETFLLRKKVISITDYNEYDLSKYAIIDENNDNYLLAIYKPDNNLVVILKKK